MGSNFGVNGGMIFNVFGGSGIVNGGVDVMLGGYGFEGLGMFL